MAGPSKNRLKGIRCEVCNKVLLGFTEENGLTVWDRDCKKPYSVLKLLDQAINEGYLSPKEATKSIPALKDEVKKQISRKITRMLNTILYSKKQ